MISSTALRYFVGVARCGSFRAAADHLHVAASALSRQVALLEEDLGAPLLERGPGRTTLRLTAAGEILMRHAKGLDNEIQRVRSDIEGLKGLRRGEIRLGVPETFTRDFIPEFIARFNTKYPGINYDVHVAGTPRLVELVVNDELDIALTFNAPKMADAKHVFVRSLPICVLVPQDHPLYQRATLRLSDCAEYGMAMPDISIGAKRVYDEMFAKAKIKPRPVLVSNSYELLRSVSVAGLSIALVNQHVNYRPKRTDRFRYIPLKDPLMKPQLFTVCVREGRHLPLAARTFLEHLQRDLSKLPALVAT